MYFDIVVLPLFLRFPLLYFVFLSSTCYVSSIQIFKDFRNSSSFGLGMLEEGDLITHGALYGLKLNNRSTLNYTNLKDLVTSLFLCLALSCPLGWTAADQNVWNESVSEDGASHGASKSCVGSVKCRSVGWVQCGHCTGSVLRHASCRNCAEVRPEDVC